MLALVGPDTRCAYNTCGGAAFSECANPEEAKAIDTKVDDGMPSSGVVQPSAGGNYIDNSPYATAINHTAFSCVTDIGGDYENPKNYKLPSCTLLFKAAF